MTHPERVITRLERWMTPIIVFCALGTCVCFAGLGYLQLQVKGQASKGEDARTRQQAVFPVSLKLYEAAYADGKISRADLECFKTGRRCPRPEPHTP
jgi:hypothetical protein